MGEEGRRNPITELFHPHPLPLEEFIRKVQEALPRFEKNTNLTRKPKVALYFEEWLDLFQDYLEVGKE